MTRELEAHIQVFLAHTILTDLTAAVIPHTIQTRDVEAAVSV